MRYPTIAVDVLEKEDRGKGHRIAPAFMCFDFFMTASTIAGMIMPQAQLKIIAVSVEPGFDDGSRLFIIDIRCFDML